MTEVKETMQELNAMAKRTVFREEMTAIARQQVTPVPQLEEIQALLIASAHFIVQVLSQDPKFRMQGKAISDRLDSVMDALGIHYEDCGCGCKGQ